MRHLLVGMLVLPLLSSCAGGLATLQEDLTRTARAQMMRTLAAQYSLRLGGAVDAVVGDLARDGGYLDNPLTRILLPPPLGIVLGAVRDLQGDPQAGLLSVLINHAAEQAIPVAAPILRTALAQITPAEARAVLDAGTGTGTALLRVRTAEALKAAMRPRIASVLAGSGALRIYGELLDAYRKRPVPGEAAAPPAAAVTDLEAYVAAGAVDGLFAVLGEREAAIRGDLDRTTGGRLRGLGVVPPE